MLTSQAYILHVRLEGMKVGYVTTINNILVYRVSKTTWIVGNDVEIRPTSNNYLSLSEAAETIQER